MTTANVPGCEECVKVHAGQNMQKSASGKREGVCRESTSGAYCKLIFAVRSNIQSGLCHQPFSWNRGAQANGIRHTG